MTDLFNKHIKKATSRTKEKLLEGIGKAKATQDEVFDAHAANLSKQAKSCERLHKDIKAYAQALKTLNHAERTLRDTIREAYEAEWPEREHLTALLDNQDIQTSDLDRAICEDLVHTVSQYVGQFSELKKKVDKRGRKLVDYDHAKHSYNSLKASSKKPDTDPKVAKAYVELQQCEALYKEINSELLEILPATFDSRITFFVDTLQSMFNAHSIYQTESSRINKQIVTQLDKLGESMDYLRVPRQEPRPLTPIDTATDDRESTPSPMATPAETMTTPATNSSARSSVTSLQPPRTTVTPATPTANASPSPAPSATPSSNPFDEEDHQEEEEKFEQKVYPKLNAATAEKKEKREKDPTNPFDEDSEDETAIEVKPENPSETKKEVTSSGDQRKVIRSVKASHEYKAADSDELSFGPGEIIKVLESVPSDQLDDGWQLGEKEDGTRGVFPENFTKPLP